MTESDLFPQSYQQWRECITVRCCISLTKSYIASRLKELRNPSHPKTEEFCQKYGEDYLRQIIQWFEMAEKETA